MNVVEAKEFMGLLGRGVDVALLPRDKKNARLDKKKHFHKVFKDGLTDDELGRCLELSWDEGCHFFCRPTAEGWIFIDADDVRVFLEFFVGCFVVVFCCVIFWRVENQNKEKH